VPTARAVVVVGHGRAVVGVAAGLVGVGRLHGCYICPADGGAPGSSFGRPVETWWSYWRDDWETVAWLVYLRGQGGSG
jgi:hypothetical protein